LTAAKAKLLQLVKKDATADLAYGLLAQICYWQGEVSPAAARLELYDEGIEYGKTGVAINEDSLASNFWLAVNYGLYAKERGIKQGIQLIDPIERHLKKSEELDPSYFYGAPPRALGRFYHQLPGWPFSRGDVKKALGYLEQALEFGPTFYLNHIYIADIYISLKKTDKARQHLQWVIKAPLARHHPQEDSRDKEIAKEMLRGL
jgi:tetratricopeptide (TPR) repeat protein